MDPLTLITIAKGLSSFVPMAAKWLGGDSAESVAKDVVDVAKHVTCIDDEHEAAAAIAKDPELQVKLQQAMNPLLIARLDNDTKQMAEINATMRAEVTSNSLYKSGWRPGFGWALLFTWTIQSIAIMAIIGYVVVKSPNDLGGVLTGISSILGPVSVMWGVALAILGININKRSQDKMVSTGMQPLGLLGQLTSVIKRG